MRTCIRGSWVVGYENGHHVLDRDFEVVYEVGRILYVGPRFAGNADEIAPGQDAAIFCRDTLHTAFDSARIVFQAFEL